MTDTRLGKGNHMDASRPNRWPLRLGLLGVGLLMLWLTACGEESTAPTASSQAEAAPTYHDYEGVELALPLPRPNFVLTDTDGDPFDFRTETGGRVTLLTFGFTHCPDVCPLHMSAISRAIDMLEPQQQALVDVVFVGTDVERDTPASVREWLDHFSTDFIGLSGDEQSIRAAQERANVQPARRVDAPDGSYVMEHVSWVLLYTPDDIAHLRYPLGVQSAQWASDLKTLIQKGW